MNVLITGGTGFVGSWMQKTQPHSVACRYLDSKGYKYFWDDFQDDEYKYIVHLAPIEPSRAIECAKRNNARLLYCSSGAVYYGNNEYAENKRKWEKECIDSGVDVVIARLFTFQGAGLDENKAIYQFEKAAHTGKPLRIWGDGSAVRSYMHGSELGKWMWAILLRGVSGEAYDVGSDVPITMLELANTIASNVTPKAEIIIENGIDPMPYYMPKDTAKTRRLLTE